MNKGLVAAGAVVVAVALYFVLAGSETGGDAGLAGQPGDRATGTTATGNSGEGSAEAVEVVDAAPPPPPDVGFPEKARRFGVIGVPADVAIERAESFHSWTDRLPDKEVGLNPLGLMVPVGTPGARKVRLARWKTRLEGTATLVDESGTITDVIVEWPELKHGSETIDDFYIAVAGEEDGLGIPFDGVPFDQAAEGKNGVQCISTGDESKWMRDKVHCSTRDLGAPPRIDEGIPPPEPPPTRLIGE
jgi:hypothetical protein